MWILIKMSKPWFHGQSLD